MWIRFGKPDASMAGNGLLAGLVAITAPSGFVNTVGAAIIGFFAGMLVCLSVEFVERMLKVDDPVGAISVHGACGLWGVISVGLFADGTSNYGGSWNGVNGSVRGLFYGDPSQLVAQLIGCATLMGIIFTLSYILNWLVDVIVGQRVGAQSELEGLDLPEVSLVSILDADKEGFLRSERSLIQTIGRAARNANGKAILYADKITDSMRRAIGETNRRRSIQEAYNREHNITPQTIIKPVEATLVTAYEADYFKVPLNLDEYSDYTRENIKATIAGMEAEMREAARRFEFERAAELRDRIKYLRERELQMT